MGNVKDAGEDKKFIDDLMIMLETGSDYMEDLVTVLKDLDKEYKYADIDKDKFYEEAAKKQNKQDNNLHQNKYTTPAISIKPDTIIGSSGVGA